MKNKKRLEGFYARDFFLLAGISVVVFIGCICIGSVNVPLKDIAMIARDLLYGNSDSESILYSIIVSVRLPRVLCVALYGASLSLCGAAMQGLLRNPLAEGSTLGISSGASLGAVIAIAFGIRIPLPGMQGSAVMLLAMVFAFLSLLLILTLAYRLDHTLATNTIILIGVIYNMFSTSIISLIQTFAGEKVKTIVFWMLGSLAGSTYADVVTMLAALLLCSGVILWYARELNAFAIGEDNARHVGINVKQVKLVVMIAVAALIGICVSIGGAIGFIGLVIPHITRMVTGPNHRRLLPAVMFAGAIFLMLADLISRVIFRPLELPIGVVTSIIGSFVFVYIFYSTKKVR